MTDGTGTTRYAYDAADQRISALSPSGGFLYSYDLDGNLLSRTYPNALKTSYSYNDPGELIMASVKGKKTFYSQDPNGNLVSSLHPNGVLDERTYDAAGRVTEIKGTDPHGKLFYSRSYTYDPVGNPLTTKAQGPHEHANGWWGTAWNKWRRSLSDWQETYSYDSRDRLTRACMNESCSHYYAYSYDPVGNRTKLETRRSTTSYSYDQADELVGSSKQKRGRHPELTRYTYDPNGNETTEGSTQYSYNLENTLTQVVDSGKKVSYTYTGDGLMSTRSTRSEITAYAWDTSSDLAQLAVETTRKSQGWHVNTDTTAYTYGVGPIGAETQSGAYTFHTDALGSVIGLSDDHGTLTQSYRYTPYGGSYGSGLSGDAGVDSLNSMRFAGQYLDSESDLYNMRAREYEPGAGRFLEIDPVECSESCASTYVYALDQPTILIDPSGEGAMMAGLDYPGAEALASRPSIPKTVHVTYFSAGSFVTNPHPSANSHWTAEKVTRNRGWRICGYNKPDGQHPNAWKHPDCSKGSRTGPRWVYDESAPDHGRKDYPGIRAAAKYAKNRKSISGYVFVAPGRLMHTWKYKDPPGVYITRHYIEAYNSSEPNPAKFPGWKKHQGGSGHEVPAVAVRLSAVPRLDGPTAARYVYKVCRQMKGHWMGIWASSEGLDDQVSKVRNIDMALNACSRGERQRAL
jgi:RHS repeat-associated protein